SARVRPPTQTGNSDPERVSDPSGSGAPRPAVIVARKDFPAKDLREFLAYLQKHGDGVKQAHGGIGSSSHMACLLFTSATGVQPSLVAYRRTGPAVNDLIGGHVHFFFQPALRVAPHHLTRH